MENVSQITEQDTEQQLDTHVEDAIEPLCRVLIHNDSVTPYDFVILILQRMFKLKLFEAEQVTLLAHTSGIAYVATLPCPEAKRRVGKAHFAASLEGFPLTFSIEPE